MFIYHFIDKYGISTPADFAYNKDMDYLKSLVESGEYQELVIDSRIF